MLDEHPLFPTIYNPNFTIQLKMADLPPPEPALPQSKTSQTFSR